MHNCRMDLVRARTLLHIPILFFSFILGFSFVSSAQTNLFPLYSSGDYSGGSGDNTNVTDAQLKLVGVVNYPRIIHLSANSGISAVYNYQTNKNVYWGEPGDIGQYWFRGRDLVLSGGKLGIGNTTPQNQLDVYGTAASTSFLLNNGAPGSGYDLQLTGKYNTDQYDMIAIHRGWDPNAVYIAGYNAPISAASGITTVTQHVYIGNPTFSSNYLAVNLVTGGVGIGTNQTEDPNNRLFVETGIRTRKITVDQASWPDYVFSPDYHLIPLDSVGLYIAAHRHLPGMPSADSVAKNGVELSDSQAQLLKKVEELTLYVLQQQKKLQEVEAENKQMARRMEELLKDVKK